MEDEAENEELRPRNFELAYALLLFKHRSRQVRAEEFAREWTRWNERMTHSSRTRVFAAALANPNSVHQRENVRLER